MEIPENFEKIKKKQQNNEITQQQAADSLGVSRATYVRWVNEND